MISGDLLQKLSSLGKGSALSIAMAGAGFFFHVAVASNAQEVKIVQHDAQIQKLIDGQIATTLELNKIFVALARVEGKQDVLNQKIDDDRSTSHQRH